MATKVGGRLERIKLAQLVPDWENPRFLPGVSETFESDLDVFVYLDKKYNAFPVADSIARHGYFESEPLIALRDKDEERYVVLEGNRRLTALKALADSEIREAMNPRRWRRLPDDYQVPAELPVLVVGSRESVAPILGFRHVTGITPWDPYQQALYVASMIDGDSSLDAEAVADLIGRSVSEVRSFYRNFSIVEQAEEEFDISDTKRVVDEFGVWTRAMTSTGIRSYIKAPAPREVVEREYPLPSDMNENLEQLIVWLFGVPRSDEDRAEGKKSREGRAITDSRQLSRLGTVLGHPRGRALLEDNASLEDAERATYDEREAFAAALADARVALDLALKHRPKRVTKPAAAVLDAIADVVRQLRGEDGNRIS